MISEEEIKILEAELNMDNASEDVKKILDKLKQLAVDYTQRKNKYIEKRRNDPYQSELNRLNRKIYWARKTQNKENLEIFQKEHDLLMEKHQKGLV